MKVLENERNQEDRVDSIENSTNSDHWTDSEESEEESEDDCEHHKPDLSFKKRLYDKAQLVPHLPGRKFGKAWSKILEIVETFFTNTMIQCIVLDVQ